jgi:predicted nucleic acid-binding protein
MTDLVLDTSAAVPYLVRSHNAHAAVRRRVSGRALALTAHSLAETYSVLTRLPGDARLAPADAATLIESNFAPAVAPKPATLRRVPQVLAPLGIVGGAVYDALVALAALAHGLPLGTRDARALGTYRALGAAVELLGD